VSESQLLDKRMAQVRDLRHREQQRKADMFGAENFRPHRSRGPIVPLPQLLVNTRAEDEKARNDGMDKSEPKRYQFIKESLVALENEYAEQVRTARELAYEHNRSRLKVSNSSSALDLEEEEPMATKISKMSDEEFKALAIRRKQCADKDVQVSQMT